VNASAAVRGSKDLRLYLRALFGSAPEGFVEIAHRYERDGRQGPMHRGRTGIFRAAGELEPIAREIERLAHGEHVWVGVTTRRPHPETGELGGTKAHVAPARVLWIDCDSAGEAFPLDRLQRHCPQPHMIVASGGGYHAYWLLREAIQDPDWLRAANERLAEVLSGDRQSADAARILRPPGTANFKSKYGRPRAVELVFAGCHRRYSVEEVLGALPGRRSPGRKAPAPVALRSSDRLQRIAPRAYFLALTGLAPSREGKVCCPFPAHADPGPSCHVYESAAEGWYCFGCGRGGDIYELAGELWGLRREGREFLALRDLLAKHFGTETGQARMGCANRTPP
jgi:RepB DNA-primase from phage plasmid/CHC2 zinc finger